MQGNILKVANMRSGKNKIYEEIIWGVGMGLGLENVQVWVQAVVLNL